ncbi:unnamed protein product, partial [marine sediment metagenome]
MKVQTVTIYVPSQTRDGGYVDMNHWKREAMT